ncbi:2-oxo acid dehydrogenase subunit E2 [Tepidimicrobium xylanilyticum]
MVTEVIMPKAGMDMREGQIIKWRKKEGDYVEAGEVLLEIMTDKVNMEVEAETSGYLLKILYEEGAKVPVITTIAYIGDKGEEIPEIKEKAEIPSEQEKPSVENELIQEESRTVSEAIVETGKVRATPAARRIARERNIDLTKIKGTGPKGRIQRADVESYKEDLFKITPLAKRIAEIEGINLETIEGSGHDGKILKEDVVKSLAGKGVGSFEDYDALDETGTEIIPMSNVRKIIAERMTESYFSAPTFTLNIEVDMRKAIKLREDVKDIILKETGKKATINDIILLATSRALMKHPFINSSLSGDNIILHKYVNLAFAIGLEDGLLTPVIKDAHEMSLSEIVVSAKDLQERALNRKLTPDELQGSTFTVSNLGMFGITYFNPIINPPNTAILGVSAIVDKLVKIDEEITTIPVMNLSLTLDHRVIDGVIGAKFLQELKYLLENPLSMLI